MFDVLRFWLDRGVDGFRLDAVRRIMKDPALRDNPPNPDRRSGDSTSRAARTTRSCTSTTWRHPDIHPVFRRAAQAAGRLRARRRPPARR